MKYTQHQDSPIDSHMITRKSPQEPWGVGEGARVWEELESRFGRISFNSGFSAKPAADLISVDQLHTVSSTGSVLFEMLCPATSGNVDILHVPL